MKTAAYPSSFSLRALVLRKSSSDAFPHEKAMRSWWAPSGSIVKVGGMAQCAALIYTANRRTSGAGLVTRSRGSQGLVGRWGIEQRVDKRLAIASAQNPRIVLSHDRCSSLLCPRYDEVGQCDASDDRRPFDKLLRIGRQPG